MDERIDAVIQSEKSSYFGIFHRQIEVLSICSQELIYSVFHNVVTIFHNAGKIFHNVGKIFHNAGTDFKTDF